MNSEIRRRGRSSTGETMVVVTPTMAAGITKMFGLVIPYCGRS